ncbi:amino acid kinase family protein [Mesorhizobium sp. ASY16-5R]|uniref:amino acid kinase family protein n=1 Tax=Mesorhizobium sp. ASY16-5R TaxID=3445772 RepID=UPI003FA13970
MKPTVVKLGGSTARTAELDAWIAALMESAAPLVVVPGGGPFADTVRDAQRSMGFSDAAAHKMAILAMEQFGQVILDRHPRFVPAPSVDDIEAASATGRIPVWMPSEMAVSAPEIPVSWDVTSDSLAAWLAGRLEAETLLLIKQTDGFSASDDVASLSARGVVDAALPSMMPENVALRLAGPRDAATAAADLASGKLPGTLVALASGRLRRTA